MGLFIEIQRALNVNYLFEGVYFCAVSGILHRLNFFHV
ncbi:hypothetical protein PCIT_a1101 [Pseudoalteromonas citrea]|uniref:Uncharacterized protein n=1 Tax=Pseudoalteromonas citrea TaxID=43655 RepID=A0AAD4FTG7_9GAMM|nr:hypothetical protein PCIT_a1101 [Pseudoalteromonas citrea]